MKNNDPFLAAMVAAVLSLLIVGLSIQLAHKKGWFDDPNDPRKIHKGMIPRLGGPGIALAFLVSVILFSGWLEGIVPGRYYALVFSALALHVIGLLDDFVNLRARFKFGVQVMAAVVTVAAGFSFSAINLPFFTQPLQLGFVGPVLTVLWITGIANALNMIDGMDGLAGGIGLIAASSFGVIHILLGNGEAAVVSFALAGALIGFPFFNFPTARIFMGDSGSLFLGYVLSVLPLLDATGKPWMLGVLPAGTILAIPIFDVFAAVIRRKRRGDSVMSPDREHIHHKLMDFGLDVRQILAIIYAVCIGLGGVVALGFYVSSQHSVILQLLALALLAGCFVFIHFARERRKISEH